MTKNKRMALVLAFIFTINLLLPNYVGADISPNPYEVNIKKSVAYLKSIQNEDGGFPWYLGDKIGESDHVTSAWVIMGLSAAGENLTGTEWRKNGKNPVDYLVQETHKLESTTDYARQLLALSTVNSYEKEKKLIINKIKSGQKANGHFGQTALYESDYINAHMWAIIALVNAGEAIPHAEKAKRWLINAQNKDGGFAWYLGLDSDVDDTAIAIQTLVALGEDPEKSITIKKALKYIKSQQQKDGGFSSGWSISEANASSDSWVWQALIAVDEKHDGENWTVGGKNVADHLLGLQDAKGYFYWMQDEKRPSIIDTAYALMALSGLSFLGDFEAKEEDEVKILSLKHLINIKNKFLTAS